MGRLLHVDRANGGHALELHPQARRRPDRRRQGDHRDRPQRHADGVANCADGGCPRCASDAPPGAGYDTCVCVHAEQNAIVLAARHGNATNRGVLYATLRPCFGCAKEAIQAGLRELVFDDPYEYGAGLEEAYRRLIAESGVTLRQHPQR
jgi:deoxycytidylate deaminase